MPRGSKNATATAPAEGVDSTATVATTNETPADRRGRPRPQLTLERDKLVADKLAEYELGQEWTKNEVAEATGLDVATVYHCLNRLSWSGNVEKVGRGKFRRTAGADGQPTPYSSDYVNKPVKTAKVTVETPVAEPAQA